MLLQEGQTSVKVSTRVQSSASSYLHRSIFRSGRTGSKYNRMKIQSMTEVYVDLQVMWYGGRSHPDMQSDIPLSHVAICSIVSEDAHVSQPK